ncbi:MAG: hypothetical protein ACPL6D_07935, partial [Thermodesulfobacteriota bacterium]
MKNAKFALVFFVIVSFISCLYFFAIPDLSRLKKE